MTDKLNRIEIGRRLSRMRLGRLLFKAVEVLGKFERRKSMEDVFDRLEEIYPDNGASCICENMVDEDPLYDIQVIMPVYNTASTLRRAIDSVLTQTGDVRVLLTIVNDGSPDNSAEILKDYSDIPGVEIITQSNKGFSGARNTALRHIKAKYVTFLDSDDRLPSDALAALCSAAERGGHDIVQGSFIFVEDDREKPHILPDKDKDGSMMGFTWGKLFRAPLFSNIHFPEGYWYEDTIMGSILIPLTEAGKKASISTPVYYYINNPEGISRTAHKSIRVLDTIYVTRSVYNDRERLGHPMRPDEYETFLRQTVTNLLRVNSHGDPRLTRLAFFAMARLRKRYFPDAIPPSSAMRYVHDALLKGKVNSFLYIAGLV